MSQPCERNCNVEQPGDIDNELNEFWVGNPFEIYMSQNLSSFERNRMFLNTGDGQFVDVSYSVGIDADSDGRSSVPIDINDDGMLDLVLRQAGGGPLVILENKFPSANYLKITLQGTKSNKQGIGARITATSETHQVVREVYPVNTYRSQRPLPAHLGLGDSTSVKQLTIQWPSGIEQTLENIECNQHILVTEESAEWQLITPGEPIGQ